MLNKAIIYSTCCALTLSSCGYAGAGAILGSQYGESIGSAIGAINGGWRGSAIGSLVGMATGAVVGAGIGGAVDSAQKRKAEKAYRDDNRDYADNDRPSRRDIAASARDYRLDPDRQETAGYRPDRQQAAGYHIGQPQDSGFDPTGGGDDRIEFEPDDASTPAQYHVGGATTVPSKTVSATALASQLPGFTVSQRPALELRNATFTDTDADGAISQGEQATVSFDILNTSRETQFNLVPIVVETTANKHISISPSVQVESIAPGAGVRYTATILAAKRLKDADLTFHIAVAQGGKDIASTVQEFQVKAIRK